MSDQVCVGTFANRAEAEIARGFLESAGILGTIAADDCGGGLPQMSSRTGVRLLVAKDDALEAAEVLRELETLPDRIAGDEE